MRIDTYISLAQKYKGQCYGYTNQGQFISTINNTRKSGASSWFYFLRKTPVLLNEKGLCFGLLHAFFFHMTHSLQSPIATIAQFAALLDSYDEGLADMAARHQALDGSQQYSNFAFSDFSKTLGLNCIDAKRFMPFTNPVLLDRCKKYKDAHRVKDSQIKSIDMMQKFKDDFARINQFFEQKAPTNFIELEFFTIRDKKYLRLFGHAMGCFRFQDEDGVTKIVFYDPNGLLTIFDDEELFSDFMREYFTEIFIDMQNLEKDISMVIKLGAYTSESQDFIKKMRGIEQLAKEKLDNLPADNNQNDRYRECLSILIKQCRAAERGQCYMLPATPENHAKGLQDNFIRMSISSNFRYHQYGAVQSQDKLKKFITTNVELLRQYDLSFVCDALALFGEAPKSLLLMKK